MHYSHLALARTHFRDWLGATFYYLRSMAVKKGWGGGKEGVQGILRVCKGDDLQYWTVRLCGMWCEKIE